MAATGIQFAAHTTDGSYIRTGATDHTDRDANEFKTKVMKDKDIEDIKD